MKWEEIKKPTASGGLGLRSTASMNIALQGKWLCKFLVDGNRLWKSIVAARWGELSTAVLPSGRIRSHTSRPHDGGLWKKILLQWSKFRQCIKWQLGNGSKICFWLDVWIGTDPFMVKFQRIYEIA